MAVCFFSLNIDLTAFLTLLSLHTVQLTEGSLQFLKVAHEYTISKNKALPVKLHHYIMSKSSGMQSGRY